MCMFCFVDFFFGMEEKGALAPHLLWPPLPNIQYRGLCFASTYYCTVLCGEEAPLPNLWARPSWETS